MTHVPIPDVIREGLTALFIGINPDPISAREGHHFANPANIFWKLMYESGFTSRRLLPAEEHLLLDHNLGITNLIARSTSGIAELSPDDTERGRAVLARKIERYRPGALIFVGVTGYRIFVGKSVPAIYGEQAETLNGARVFVLPHPSGRNAHFRQSEMLDIWKSVAEALGVHRR